MRKGNILVQFQAQFASAGALRPTHKKGPGIAGALGCFTTAAISSDSRSGRAKGKQAQAQANHRYAIAAIVPAVITAAAMLGWAETAVSPSSDKTSAALIRSFMTGVLPIARYLKRLRTSCGVVGMGYGARALNPVCGRRSSGVEEKFLQACCPKKKGLRFAEAPILDVVLLG